MKIFLSNTARCALVLVSIIFGLSGCSKSTNPVQPTTNTTVKPLIPGTQFVNTYTLLDTSFNLETLSTTSSYTVTQDSTTLYGKSNVATLHYIRAANNSGLYGIDPDSEVILVAIESNGDVSFADSANFVGWTTLPIASKNSTNVPATDTSADGNGLITSGTVRYVGTSPLTLGGQKINVVTCLETIETDSYYFSINERSSTDQVTISFAPELGFMVENVDQFIHIGAVGDVSKGGDQELTTSFTIK